MYIAGVAAAQTVDKTGEKIHIKGIDISSFLNGTGTVNVEHAVQGKDSFGEETIGRIVYAKKIFKASDCDNKVQQDFWDDLEVPYLFVIIRLFDAAGHENAKAHAAQIRDAQANGEPQQVSLSIEGITTERDGSELKETIARKVSATLGPCNSACGIVLIADPQAPSGFNKQPIPWSDLKGCTIYKGDGKAEKVEDMVTLEEAGERVAKALGAGMGVGAPDSLTGGSALAKECFSDKVDLTEYTGKKDRGLARKWLEARHKNASKEDLEKALDEWEGVEKSVAELYFGLQNIYVELSKSLPDTAQHFAGQLVDPGLLVAADGTYAILWADDDFYYVVPQGDVEDFGLEDLTKIPRVLEDTHFVLVKQPSTQIGYGGFAKSEAPFDQRLPRHSRDLIPGGLADKKNPADFDHDSLVEGLRVELEHTSDPKIALEIAMDHLTEDPDYYRKLATIEKSEFLFKSQKSEIDLIKERAEDPNTPPSTFISDIISPHLEQQLLGKNKANAEELVERIVCNKNFPVHILIPAMTDFDQHRSIGSGTVGWSHVLANRLHSGNASETFKQKLLERANPVFVKDMASYWGKPTIDKFFSGGGEGITEQKAVNQAALLGGSKSARMEHLDDFVDNGGVFHIINAMSSPNSYSPPALGPKEALATNIVYHLPQDLYDKVANAICFDNSKGRVDARKNSFLTKTINKLTEHSRTHPENIPHFPFEGIRRYNPEIINAILSNIREEDIPKIKFQSNFHFRRLLSSNPEGQKIVLDKLKKNPGHDSLRSIGYLDEITPKEKALAIKDWPKEVLDPSLIGFKTKKEIYKAGGPILKVDDDQKPQDFSNSDKDFYFRSVIEHSTKQALEVPPYIIDPSDMKTFNKAYKEKFGHDHPLFKGEAHKVQSGEQWDPARFVNASGKISQSQYPIRDFTKREFTQKAVGDIIQSFESLPGFHVHKSAVYNHLLGQDNLTEGQRKFLEKATEDKPTHKEAYKSGVLNGGINPLTDPSKHEEMFSKHAFRPYEWREVYDPVGKTPENHRENIERLNNHAPITINFPPRASEQIRQSGKFKNGFHIGGSYDNRRIRVERDFHGIPVETGAEERPVYGALHINHHQEGTPEQAAGPAAEYGEAFAQLKPEVKDRSTFTNTDSFNLEDNDNANPVTDKNGIWAHYKQHSPLNKKEWEYIESQIYGGVRMDRDVESLHVPADHDDAEEVVELGKHFKVPVYQYHKNEETGKFKKVLAYDPKVEGVGAVKEPPVPKGAGSSGLPSSSHPSAPAEPPTTTSDASVPPPKPKKGPG